MLHFYDILYDQKSMKGCYPAWNSPATVVVVAPGVVVAAGVVAGVVSPSTVVEADAIVVVAPSTVVVTVTIVVVSTGPTVVEPCTNSNHLLNHTNHDAQVHTKSFFAF